MTMPMRTMLPPNLTRNHYEVRRLVAEGEGRELPNWYQLTGEQKQAEELHVELFRRAIFRAEEEQNLVSNFNSPAAERPPTVTSPEVAAARCRCPRCSTLRFLTGVITQARQLEATIGWDIDAIGKGAIVFTRASPALMSAEELARLEEAARESVDRWTGVGKLFEESTPTYAWVFEVKSPALTRDDLDRAMRRALREPYQPSHPVSITDIWTGQPPPTGKV
ncbi:hypothetical protein ACFU96_21205 [Streptomyces sp. NPDC057620]|uniref:hypothetical protein n=1 Tax=Streptomyces sp. NPDC057620 TaxID=3346185 RepID=UPI0036CC8841